MNRFVIKLALIFGGIAILISVYLVFAYYRWSQAVTERMPSEGKAIFAQIDPERCSLGVCSSCTAEQCPEAEGKCAIREYKWASGDQTYFRLHCDSAPASTSGP